MKEIILQTYGIVLSILLGYIVWLLKEQKKRQQKDAIERNKRIADENEKRDANSAGTMLLLRVQLIEYHDRYMKIGSIPSYAYENFCQMYEAYHRLGGNGMVEKMHEEIMGKAMSAELLLQYISYLLTGIGVLAFLVSVIVQAVKEMPVFKKIQTSVVALAVSLILTPISVIVLCNYYRIVIEWYYIFAAIVAAFIVYLVSTGGWERVASIWNRSKYKK